MESLNPEPLTLEKIDHLLELPPDIEKIYQEKKRIAYVGPYDAIKRKFHALPIVDGWSAYSRGLQTSGAIVAVKYKLPMVNTDIIPPHLVKYVLEHEAVESALDKTASDNQHQIAFDRLSELRITKSITTQRPRWNHAFATVRQMRLAQQEGKLDEMMQFADELESREENKRNAVGNKELRDSIYEMLTTAV